VLHSQIYQSTCAVCVFMLVACCEPSCRCAWISLQYRVQCWVASRYSLYVRQHVTLFRF